MKSLFKKGIKTKAKNYEPIQGLTNCTHGDEHVHNVHAKRLSLALNYVQVNQSKHI